MSNPFVLLRSAGVSVFLSALLALSGSPVRAQSFDEFDDEFEEETPAPRAAAPSAPADEFEDDAATPASGTPADEGESAPMSDDFDGPAEGAADRSGDGRVTDARGDLLNENGSHAWRHRRIVLHNTYDGTTGGIHVADAGSGPSQSFRIQLLTDFFFANGFLNPGDDNSHVGGALSLNYTPWDFLEIYASIQSYANSNATESPVLFQALGDSILGLKGFYEIAPFFVLGGDLGIHLLNTVGDIGLVGESTSLSVRLNAALDLRALEGVEFPLIARLNLQYYFDQSANLTNRVEQARYDALPTTGPDARLPYESEDRHLLSRVERFALNINRTDSFDIALGTEWPIHVMTDFTISPILEWVLNVPVNSRGYNCLIAPGEDMPGAVGRQDGCLANQGFASMPSTLTLGARVLPPVPGLGITLAVDIGTSGMNSFVRELAGNAPYSVLIGASYAVDNHEPIVEPIVREVERTVEVRIPPPVTGFVRGTVTERGATAAVSGAVVSMTGGPEGAAAFSTDASGRFRSYDVAPGEYTFSISHPEYRSGTCSATIPEAGGEASVSCELEALPRMGNVRGHVGNDSGGSVSGATVSVTGPTTFSAVTDSSGTFSREGLPPGSYEARIEADGYLLSTGRFTVAARETAAPDFSVIARPARSLITVRDREIVIRRQVNFATDSAEILPDSIPLLSEIADVLLRNPGIRRIEIQGHTDNRGSRERNMDLSQRRAEAVRDWLIAAGVESSRLEARGYGDTEPRVPNLTAANRARNRRVQFMITERDEE
jgi:outer membrane protein OmpA-like peptidoglycan-associated protein